MTDFFGFCDANQLAISFLLFQLDIPLEEEKSLDFSEKSTLESIEKLPKKFILCGSRKLEKRIRSQSIFKLEVKSLLYFLKTVRPICQLSTINLFTDAKSILHLRMSKTSCPYLMRASMQLSTFSINLRHTPREYNFCSDRLGRLDDGGQTLEPESAGGRSLSPRESEALLKCITVPDNFTINSATMQKLMSQDSLKAIIEPPKKRTRVNKQIFDTSSIISKPTLKPKRRIKPFQVILTKSDKSREIISVNSAREIEAPPFLTDQDGGPQGSDNDSSPFRGFGELPNQQMGNPPPLVDMSDNLRDDRQNSLSTQEQIESFNAIEDLSNMARIYGKGLMTVEQFIQSQANDVDIANFKRPTKTIQGIICAKTRPSNVSTTLFKPIISRNLLISYCNTLHNSPQFFHQSAPQLLRITRGDFLLLIRGWSRKK